MLLTDRGYDADRFRQALATRGTAACILTFSLFLSKLSESFPALLKPPGKEL